MGRDSGWNEPMRAHRTGNWTKGVCSRRKRLKHCNTGRRLSSVPGAKLAQVLVRHSEGTRERTWASCALPLSCTSDLLLTTIQAAGDAWSLFVRLAPRTEKLRTESSEAANSELNFQNPAGLRELIWKRRHVLLWSRFFLTCLPLWPRGV
ncbi:uncharacterized protein BDV17DRAFT_53866 [Aspergillus undulatus]|uniref:uncharacterized protein n=1 Tax=Aspergillus undulatus TaxID=1810928 RepID=UPI003CCD0F04